MALPTAALALALAVLALRARRPGLGDWLVHRRAPAGSSLGSSAVVGLASVLVSPAYLAESRGSLVSPERRQRAYYAVLYAFWAILLAVPLAGNLGAAWLLVEATTAASALLVGFSGKARALEAAWKYLVLTSLGLGRCAARPSSCSLPASPQAGSADSPGKRFRPTPAAAQPRCRLRAPDCRTGGEVGWAPVHNWLPDAHSESPPPVSALLSAALLPAVLLVAWRSQHALAPVVGERTTQTVLIAFGLASLAVAIPFLWRSLPWKRLLAYSSLEHMGVIALGSASRRRSPWLGSRSTSPHTRSRRRSVSTLRTPLVSHDPSAGEPRSPVSVAASAPLGRRWGSRSPRSQACRPRLSSSARC